MNQQPTKKSFNKRAFVSTAMFISGLSLPFSGIMNHELQFEQLTNERHFWMSVHNMGALLFVTFAVLHIIYNRKALMNYIKKTSAIFISKEALAALVIVVVIVGIFASHAFHVR